MELVRNELGICRKTIAEEIQKRNNFDVKWWNICEGIKMAWNALEGVSL